MAKVDFFLKLDGIEGESTDSKHKGEIEIQSWSFGAANAGSHGSGGGGGTGKVKVRDVYLVVNHGKSAPKLFKAVATGEHIPKGVIACRKAGGEQEDYLKITLTDVLVSSYSHDAPHGADSPTDSIQLNMGKVEFEYKEQTSKGSVGGAVKGGWDVAKNKKV